MGKSITCKQISTRAGWQKNKCESNRFPSANQTNQTNQKKTVARWWHVCGAEKCINQIDSPRGHVDMCRVSSHISPTSVLVELGPSWSSRDKKKPPTWMCESKRKPGGKTRECHSCRGEPDQIGRRKWQYESGLRISKGGRRRRWHTFATWQSLTAVFLVRNWGRRAFFSVT